MIESFLLKSEPQPVEKTGAGAGQKRTGSGSGLFFPQLRRQTPAPIKSRRSSPAKWFSPDPEPDPELDPASGSSFGSGSNQYFLKGYSHENGEACKRFYWID